MSRRGMTLVELMVATTMTLIIMGVVAQLFGILANGVTGSRSTIDMSSQLRVVANTLRTDLAGATAPTTPPLPPDGSAGYLKIIEGPLTDDPGAATRGARLTGDCDDVLMFTTRSLGSGFVGRYDSSFIESPNAEVAWFCRQSPDQPLTDSTLFTLYRRQLLVMDYVGTADFVANRNMMPGTLPAALLTRDLSLRVRTAGFLCPNSLSDLVKPENRFLHNPDVSGTISAANFPYPINASNPVAHMRANGVLTGAREAQDVILTNVLSFDVRVFDPTAPIRQNNGVTVIPGDPGYAVGIATGAMGAYVDLGWGGAPSVGVGQDYPPAGLSYFQSIGVRASNAPRNVVMPLPTYDTGSLHYEFNGIDEDGDGLVDEGTDGIDNDLDGVVDDAGERETSPPYPVALRGLEVRIRCYEPSSRQVRQITIRHSFVPL